MKNVIFSDLEFSQYYDAKSFLEAIKEDGEQVTEQEIYNQIQRDIDFELECLQYRLENVSVNDLVAVGKIGLWHGTHDGYKVVECNNLWDGLRELWRDYDNVEIWTDAHNLHIDLYHHDGTHRLILREYKNITDTQKENFECADKTSRVLTRYTTSLLDKVA